ncbi:hypothetical protein HK405_009636 [Cladochytrium tenue]|nr:hypothetical protein HK405_009636 [Cladochytrium tenue]
MSLKELASTFGPVVAPSAKAAPTSAAQKARPGHRRLDTDEDEDEDEWHEHLRAAGADAADSDSDDDDGSSSDSDRSDDSETPRRNGVDKSRVAGSRKRKSGLFDLAADAFSFVKIHAKDREARLGVMRVRRPLRGVQAGRSFDNQMAVGDQHERVWTR